MQIDWNSVLLPSLGIPEIVVRGTLMYLGLFVILINRSPRVSAWS